MSNRAFTLLELLVVIAIMGLLGTAAVGGYSQFQRGMAERGVMDNVNQFLRTAYQRAQIDRQPVEVYLWNETLRAQSMDESIIVVGKAVAVRAHGRLSYVRNNMLVDEFGDFEQVSENDSGDYEYADGNASDSQSRLYKVGGGSGSGMQYSTVYSTPRVVGSKSGSYTLTGVVKDPGNADYSGSVVWFGYERISGVSWSVGDAYGFEFLRLDLPHGFMFGSSYSQDASKASSAVTKIVYLPDGDGGNSVTIYEMRPGDSGLLTPQAVRQTDNPANKAQAI